MKKLLVIAFVVLFAALYIIAYVLPDISDVFVKSYTAEYGTVDVDEEIDYLVVRNEKVYTADNSGTVSRIKDDGELVRRSTRIADVGGQGHYSGKRGIVGYSYDGLEKKFSPENMKELNFSDIYPKTDDSGKVTYKLKECKTGSVETGDKIFKIIDNKEWYIVTFLEKDDAETLTLGSGVKIEFNNEKILPCKVYYIEETAENEGQAKENTGNDEAGEEETGAVSDTKNEADSSDQKDKIEVIFCLDRYLENFGGLRYGTGRLIKSSKTGIILETGSIVEEDGYKGVYVLNKYDDYVFTKISVIDVIGDKTVVEMNTFYDKKSDKVLNTVKNYDTVLKQKEGKSDVNKG